MALIEAVMLVEMEWESAARAEPDAKSPTVKLV
jgi:hypothetical protein